jgi:transposase InsO family protein
VPARHIHGDEESTATRAAVTMEEERSFWTGSPIELFSAESRCQTAGPSPASADLRSSTRIKALAVHCFALTNTLKDADIRISMDGRGRWIDNVFIERLWRSLKYECVYLNAFETGSEARTGIG